MRKANEKGGVCEEGERWLDSRNQKEMKGLNESANMICPPS